MSRAIFRPWAIAASLIAGVLVAPRPARPQEPTVPTARSYVSDYVGILDSGTQREIETWITELKAKTGAEIAVVVVNSTAPMTAFDYAMKIAEAWKVGSRKGDDGVVFLVAVEDRKLQILTGYGVEGALPDGKVGEIRDTYVLPQFKRGQFAAGIRDGTLALAREIATDRGVTLTGAPSAPAPRARSSYTAAQLGLILVVLVIIVVASQFGGGGPWGGRRIHRRGPFGMGGYGGGYGGGGFGGGGFGGGGFGGFGGGSFGGGGAGGDW